MTTHTDWVIAVWKANRTQKETDSRRVISECNRHEKAGACRSASGVKADKPATWPCASSSRTASGAHALGPPLTASNEPTHPTTISLPFHRLELPVDSSSFPSSSFCHPQSAQRHGTTLKSPRTQTSASSWQRQRSLSCSLNTSNSQP